MRAWVKGRCSFGDQRAEVLNAGPNYKYTEGQQLYFADSVYFPEDFPATQKGHCIVMQIHTAQRGVAAKPPALALNCRDRRSDQVVISARGDSRCEWTAPMMRGGWHRFVWRVRFSRRNGSWALWYAQGDGTPYSQVVNDCASRILLSSSDYGYYKVGLYRGVANQAPAAVYHDEIRVGTSFGAVAR
jgi:hypothetical protein